jgi:excinuclease ABC subunit A
VSAGQITLRGVEVHNLKQVDLDLPHKKLIAFCGLSGSGKTSLAIDTLYAEGQRRYIESFSAYTRQFLEQLDKPEAERIDGIPAAVCVKRRQSSPSSRSTVSTATEIHDYLRLLFAKVGKVNCPGCGHDLTRDTPQSAAARLSSLQDSTRFMIGFAVPLDADMSATISALREDGFRRVITGGTTKDIGDLDCSRIPSGDVYVVIDRLTVGSADETRIRDSVETAFQSGGRQCRAFVEVGSDEQEKLDCIAIDGRNWRQLDFSDQLVCGKCQIELLNPEPQLFSFNSPLGACGECEGFGNVVEIDMDRVVPDRKKSIREGAIAPWNTAAYSHELEELLALADDYHLPVDVPFEELTDDHLRLIREGVAERDFGGLVGFFNWLERRKYKMHLRVFLSRWRSYRTCAACGGARLRPEALAVKVGGNSIADLSAMKVDQCREYFLSLKLGEHESSVARLMIEEVNARLAYLESVGLSYLTLDRTLRTLSAGESQRVALTTALGSSLVNMLYVLDEPSVGLHPNDLPPLVGAIEGLRNRGNTVIVVEHEEALLRAADEIVEIGPGAGERGGEVVFQGSIDEMQADTSSLTGDYLAGRRGVGGTNGRRTPDHGWIRLAGARGNNLQNVTVEFPLGLLCVVTGVSGAGKSTLVQDTLYPALCRRMRKDAPTPLECDDVFGDGQLEDCVMVDQSPIGRSPRSNPVTFIKAFDEIRAVFADTIEARTRNFAAGHFSFNVDGGRCTKCQGDGFIKIDMQFLDDVYMKCPQCNGRRYRPEVLEIKVRGRNIADVLDLTVREAFIFFRGRPKVQARLKRLIDVGLDYLRLGQPANTLSGGESQRLKLATYMSSARRGRTLFILDEPTTGLHFSDVVQLLDCFDALLAVGHSLIVVEHNLQIMKAADYVIDLGPGAAEEGGEVGACGTPEEIARDKNSITGQFLAKALADDICETT